MATINDLVLLYRRQLQKPVKGTNTELEVRFQKVTQAFFTMIFKKCMSDPAIFKTAKLTQVISTIKTELSVPAGTLRPMRIREIEFVGGVKKKERIVSKVPLCQPFRTQAYNVALSSETGDSQSFIADESVLIRTKARVSFMLTIPAVNKADGDFEWRLDLTVVRKIAGGDAGNSLKGIVKDMFKAEPPFDETNLFMILASSDVYLAEVEAEFMGPEHVLDAVRPADITSVVNFVLNMADPSAVQAVSIQSAIYFAASQIITSPGYLRMFETELGLKRLLPVSVALTRESYGSIFPPVGYFVTDKADGVRALAIVKDRQGFIITASNRYDYQSSAPSGFQEFTSSIKNHADDTIVDGELCVKDGVFHFYAFDVIMCNGVNLSPMTMAERLASLDPAVQALKAKNVPISAKAYQRVMDGSPAGLEKLFLSVYEKKYDYSIDGMMISNPDSSYVDTTTLKWKSSEHITIDFLARRAPSSVLGKKPFIDAPGHKLYILCVGIRSDLFRSLGFKMFPWYNELFSLKDSEAYIPIPFAPSDTPYAFMYQHPNEGVAIDGHIVEMRRVLDDKSRTWEMTRRRDDRQVEMAGKKYFGNDFRVAEETWMLTSNPIELRHLWSGVESSYFQNKKDDIYTAQTALNSSVKGRLIRMLNHKRWVVDLGAGKGQDLHRYFNSQILNVIAVDKDSAALTELVSRKYMIAAKPPHRNEKKVLSGTTVFILVADVNDKDAGVNESLLALGMPPQGADAVVCNMAMHYFMSNAASLQHFVSVVAGSVKPGGLVILTAFIGEAVHKLFIDEKIAPNACWNMYESGVLKYSIKRLYSSKTLETAGQKIGVMHPFSKGEYYEEYLVNTKALTAEFGFQHCTVVSKASFSESVAEFTARDAAKAALLTDADRKYSSLYGEITLAKKA